MISMSDRDENGEKVESATNSPTFCVEAFLAESNDVDMVCKSHHHEQ